MPVGCVRMSVGCVGVLLRDEFVALLHSVTFRRFALLLEFEMVVLHTHEKQ